MRKVTLFFSNAITTVILINIFEVTQRAGIIITKSRLMREAVLDYMAMYITTNILVNL